MILAAAAMSFVVITLDDVSWSHWNAAMTATMQYEQNRTVYPRAFTNIPLCGPSRAAFLTGQEGETTGIVGNAAGGLWGGNFITHALAGAGYRRMIIGKMPNGFEGTPAQLGFNRWAVLEALGGDRYFDADLDVNGTVSTAVGYVPDDLYRRTRNCVEGSRPFFCWHAAIGAHAPADAAPRYRGACNNLPFNPGPAFNEADLSDKPSWMRGLPLVKADKAEQNWREQCDTLRADDDGVASVLALVAGDPEVCVIVTSDNGRLAGQHRITGKSVLYEESINVPLATWNCATVAGIDDRLVSNVDLPAHILSLAGVNSLRPLDGRPLVGDARTRVRIVGGTDVPAAGWRRRNTVEWLFENGETEYYDLRDDQWQERNVVPPPQRRSK